MEGNTTHYEQNMSLSPMFEGKSKNTFTLFTQINFFFKVYVLPYYMTVLELYAGRLTITSPHPLPQLPLSGVPSPSVNPHPILSQERQERYDRKEDRKIGRSNRRDEYQEQG